ncbi:hypothetical protein ACF0H5_003292 [Mactra antiquata]
MLTNRIDKMETDLEKYIKDFVYAKIQEMVYLDLATNNTISVKHRSKHGSVALAMFWLRVLRHQNNYPMPKYPYKDTYDKNGYNKVILKVDSVTLTTFMNSGTLTIQGQFVLEWFVNVFKTILEAYDAPIRDSKPESAVYRQYTESWKKLRDQDSARKGDRDAQVKVLEDKSMEILDDDDGIDKPDDVTNTEVEIVDVTETSTISNCEHLKQATSRLEEKQNEELELMTVEKWPDDVLQGQLDSLQNGCVRDGSTYIYQLWKATLQYWFSDTNRKVYIVSPYLDSTRLVDICNMVIKHRLTANLDAFYSHQKCDDTKMIYEVKQRALQKFGPKDQMFLEYKIYSQIINPLKKFNAKFIGCIHGNKAEVLTTSANFHGNDFELCSMNTVQYQVMSDVEFVTRFLAPINASVHVQE